MKLTFDSSEFLLFLDPPQIPPPPGWTYCQPGIYTTSDIKVAARSRAYADVKAERVFQRAFVKRYKFPNASLPSFLDPHQMEGVRWAKTRSRAYLAHAPGAGKTPQAIVTAELTEGPGQNLILVPPSLTAQWATEIIKFTEWTERLPSIAVIPESKRQDLTGWKADYVICAHSMMAKPWVLPKLIAMKKKTVFVDEASAFKEVSAIKTQALFGGRVKGRRVPGLIYDSRHAVLLDGSPMPNRPMELWAPTYAMSPESIDFMNQNDFGMRYCGPKQNDYGQYEFKGATNYDELKRKLRESYMHVVTEEELNHPERLRSLLVMSEDPRTVKMKAWEQKNLGRFNFDDIDENMNQGDIAVYRRELGLRKVPWVAKYVSTRLEDKDESILLFAWHREVVQNLALALAAFSPGVVLGGVTDVARERIKSDFQAGRIKLIIGNIIAMGRGHNLQRASRAVFGEFSWTDETNLQCEKRGSRRGSTREFFRCDYVVAPRSIDIPVAHALFRKQRHVRRIIG